MIVAHDRPARATLAVVSLGVSPHLEACLASLAAHEAETEFRVVCVNNSVSRLAPPLRAPPGVLVIDLDTNLGWAGALHVARAHSPSEFLVWIQEDMEVREGWLDALVAAADAHPEFAAFGSLATDRDDQPAGFAAGRAYPVDNVASWNDTDTTASALPADVTQFDWITSKGLLTRTEAWDEIGGADPRLFPLNHVDKDYCTHLRAHGLAVALVPTARLFHLGSQSSPSHFRRFVADWQEPAFNAKWGPIVSALAVNPGAVPHECHPWLPEGATPPSTIGAVRRAVGDEAALMLVPFARWIMTVRLAEEQAKVDRQIADAVRVTAEEFRSSTSWKVTAPLRALSSLLSHRPSR